MKNCTEKELWNTDFDLLPDEEFEKLLEHSAVCEYHARILDAYNQNTLPLLQEILPAGIAWGRANAITRMDLLWQAWVIKLEPISRALASAEERVLQVASLLLMLPLAAMLTQVRADHGLEFQIGVIAPIGLIMTFLTFYMIFRSFGVMTTENGTMLMMGKTEPFNTYNNSVIGNVPERLQPVSTTEEEKKLSQKIKEILSTGLTPENCRTGLELLAANEVVVSASWIHTLNKARFMRGLGEKEEAERIVRQVMEDHWDTPQARGTGFEVLSWFVELDYNEGGGTNRNLLDRRAYFITEGLKVFPTSYQLLINAFELAFLRKDNAQALDYLEQLIEVDRDVAARYFADNPQTVEIKASDAEIGRKIDMTCNAGPKVRVIGSAAAMLALMIALLLPAVGAVGHSEMTRMDGTSFGIAKTHVKKLNGTSFG